MNIEALHLKNFKRFNDFTTDLSSLDAPPKLILLIGANGSGKSSIFDAFEYLSGPAKGLRDFEQDTRVATDVSQITEDILHEIWGEPFDSDTMRARYTDPINEALERIFSASFATDLRLRKLIPALSGKPPDIRFQKGGSEVHYDLLSSGEKEVFNIYMYSDTMPCRTISIIPRTSPSWIPRDTTNRHIVLR